MPVSLSDKRALALPLVAVVVLLVAVAVGAAFFSMRAGLRRTARFQRDTEHQYLAEGILACYVNRLKMRPWRLRFYAAEGPGPHSLIQSGNYRGADYLAVIEDVVDASGTIIPDLTNLLVKVTYKELTRNYHAQVSVSIPTRLRPTNINIERFRPTEFDIAIQSDREKIDAITASEREQAVSEEAKSRVISREVQQRAADDQKSAQRINNEILQANLDNDIEKERDILSFWRQADEAIRSNAAGKYTSAFDFYRQAYDTGKSQSAIHRAVTVPRSLIYMARAKVGEYEALLGDPTASDADRTQALADARGFLEELISDYSTSDDLPYALLDLVKILRRLGENTAARSRLQELKEGWPDLHLWGEDATVAGDDGNGGIAGFEKVLLDENGSYCLEKDETKKVNQVVFLTSDGRKLRVTNDPRPKDRLSLSPDGNRLAYRAQQPDGELRLVVIDYDGDRARDLTESKGDWVPEWTDVIDYLPFNPVNIDDLPDTSGDTIDRRCLPKMNTDADTIPEFISYAQQLYSTLLEAPYCVWEPRITFEKIHIELAQEFWDDSKEEEDPSKGTFRDLALEKVVSAIVSLEAIKAEIDSGEGHHRWGHP